MTAMTTAYYIDNDDIYEDDFMRPRGSKRRRNPGKNSRARKQARFQKETGYLTQQDAQAAEERWNELIGA